MSFFVAIAPKEYNRMAVIDIGRSLQKVVLDATRMGLGTCWIGPGADQQSVIRHLGDRFDPARDHVICVCAIGYASWLKPLGVRLLTRTMSTRKPLRDLFFADVAFTTPLATDRAPFSRFGRCYEACQWSPSSYNGQTSRAAVIADASGRVARIDFAAATESRYYAAVALGIWCANWETGCKALGLAGHFARLSPKARGVGVAPSLPHYDISWLPD